MSIIKVRYNGRRFPRVVSFRGGGNTSFRSDRMVLDLEEYDAMLLLKSNSRLTPDKWEFTIEGVTTEIITEKFTPSEPLPEKRIIGIGTDKPKGRPKGGKK